MGLKFKKLFKNALRLHAFNISDQGQRLWSQAGGCIYCINCSLTDILFSEKVK